MAFTLLATKLHRPRPTTGLVARPRLTQRLDEGLRKGHRLFLVVAPAGYGKTTLVADWLTRTGVPSAWLSLDEADNDPLRFFAYLAASLERALGPEVVRPLAEAFPAAPPSPEVLVVPLINDLAAAGRPAILALDDYHVITAGPVQEAMALLLRRAPPNLHLAVLTRADPPFPLPRLRVRGRMTEIRDRDLRFTPEEMVAFLNDLHSLGLDAGQIAALESRTEGWAAGVQLAALSLQGAGPERAAEFIRAFGGSHHYIVDYLLDEVLGRQPQAVREFLVQTSILERMCAPLCDAILSSGAGGQDGTEDASNAVPPAHEILETLERSHLFLVPLDDERRWVRYHHLFADTLRGMLHSALQPVQIAELHGRACEWYRQNGFVADAIHHALQAGDQDRAAEIVEENAWSMVLRADLGTLRQWIQALHGDLVAARPWLRIYYAWALVFGEAEAAEAQLQAVEQHLQAGGTTSLSAQMQGHIAAVRAWIAYENDDQHGAATLSRRALELCPQMDASIRSGLMVLVGVGCRTQGDLAGAVRAFTEARDLAQSSGNVFMEVAARTSLGELSRMQGRLHEAEAIYREALGRAALFRSPMAAQAYDELAILHRQWNDLASARLFAERAVEMYRTWGFSDELAPAYLSLAAVLQAQKQFAEADRALGKGFQTLHGHAVEPRLVARLGAMRARLWLAQGKLEDARRWAETRGLSAEGRFDLRNEVEYVTLARILLAEGRVDDATRLLSRLQSAMEPAGRHGNLVEILLLQALALDMQAEAASALAVLERAVRLAQPEGYMRAFLDEGKPMEALLKMAVARWQDRGLLVYACKLLDAFAAEAVPPAGAQAPRAGILSERELEVLRLMAAGRSNQEIAEELVIAVGTAKRHTANIFDKLDARNRTEAVATARGLGLL